MVELTDFARDDAWNDMREDLARNFPETHEDTIDEICESLQEYGLSITIRRVPPIYAAKVRSAFLAYNKTAQYWNSENSIELFVEKNEEWENRPGWEWETSDSIKFSKKE